MAHGDGGGEQKRGRKRVKNNSESAKKRRERSRNTSAASYQGLRARDLGYGSPAQKAARKLAYELYGKGANGLTVGRQIREMLVADFPLVRFSQREWAARRSSCKVPRKQRRL